MKNLIAAVLLLGSGIVLAEPATDLDCIKCVGTAEIAKNAVGNRKIKNSAVSTNKIKNGAVTVSKVSPELSNSIGTYCAADYVVVGKDQTGNWICEKFVMPWTIYEVDSGNNANDDSLVEFICPDEGKVMSVGCKCSSELGTRNSGILAMCTMIPTTRGIASCLIYAPTYNPSLPDPRVNMMIACAQPIVTDGMMAGIVGTSISETVAKSDAEYEAVLNSAKKDLLKAKARLKANGRAEK